MKSYRGEQILFREQPSKRVGEVVMEEIGQRGVLLSPHPRPDNFSQSLTAQQLSERSATPFT